MPKVLCEKELQGYVICTPCDLPHIGSLVFASLQYKTLVWQQVDKYYLSTEYAPLLSLPIHTPHLVLVSFFSEFATNVKLIGVISSNQVITKDTT